MNPEFKNQKNSKLQKCALWNRRERTAGLENQISQRIWVQNRNRLSQAHKKITYLAKESALDEEANVSGSCRKRWLCPKSKLRCDNTGGQSSSRGWWFILPACGESWASPDSESSCQDLKAGNGSVKQTHRIVPWVSGFHMEKRLHSISYMFFKSYHYVVIHIIFMILFLKRKVY